MDAKTFDKKNLPSRHVTEGSQRAPQRSFYYAMGLTRVTVLALTFGVFLMTSPVAQANGYILGIGQSMFFSFREATKKISPDFDIRIWASDLEKALVAYRKGKFKKAHRLFKASADDGDLMAHWWLGRMNKLGQGVPQNDGRAFYHFRQAVQIAEAS